MMKHINKTTILIALSACTVGLLFGRLLFSGTDEPKDHSHADMAAAKTVWTCSMHPQIKQEKPGQCPLCGMNLIPLEADGPKAHHHADTEAKKTVWTCSMHPQIKQEKPGKCPLCGMNLIPLEAEKSKRDPMAVSMSPTAMQLAHVQTMVVGNDKAQRTIRLNGIVQADESAIYSQTTHIGGRIEQLAVNTTGEYVKKGQVIANLYSPELVTAQKELFEARKIKQSYPQLWEASWEKLKNWKLTNRQIEAILKAEKPIENFPVLADKSGTILEKKVDQGDHVREGTVLYKMADLSRVWILFDVYEPELALINVGDEIIYSVPSIPGKQFTGKIRFIDPVINPGTRVAQARVVAHNRHGALKPEMFANGMLVKRKDLADGTIVVPKSAVMWTGKRSVTYVMNKTTQDIRFRMREVVLGPQLGESYVIQSGLRAGEEIAVHGAFSIDAAAQLAGKPSMMNPKGDISMKGGHRMSMPMPKAPK